MVANALLVAVAILLGYGPIGPRHQMAGERKTR